MSNFTNLGVGPGPKRKSAPPPPFGGGPKKPDLAVMIGVGGPKKPGAGAPPMDDPEAGESPADEAGEDYGAKLTKDIEAAGASVGIHDPGQARKAAGAFFAAAAKCLSGESDEPTAEPGPEMLDEGAMQ